MRAGEPNCRLQPGPTFPSWRRWAIEDRMDVRVQQVAGLSHDWQVSPCDGAEEAS